MNFIYILSAPRSGSTLLQRILNTNINTCTLPETWFLLSQNLFLANNNGSLETGFYVNKNAITSFCENLGITSQDLFKLSIENYRQLLSNNLLNKSSYFIDKTPRNILLIDNIYKSLEDNDKIILLKRNPNEIFKSYLTYFDSFPFLKAYKFFKEIKSYSTIIENFDNSKKDKTKVLSIDYNFLVNNSDEAILLLQNFLGFHLDKNNLSLNYNLKSKKFHGDISNLHQKNIIKTKKKKGILLNIITAFFFERVSIFQRIITLPLILPSFIVYKLNPRLIKLLFKKNVFTH